MEEKRYKILDVKKSQEILDSAKLGEITWIATSAIGALILGLDIAATGIVFDMIKDNPVAVSFMPIYATLALAGGEAFSLKKFVESVKDARKAKKELNRINNELYASEQVEIGEKVL